MSIQKPDLRYTLTFEGRAFVLNFAPEGWEEDTRILYKYDPKYRGIQRSYSLPLKFVKDGSDILRYAFKKYRYEALCFLTVEVLNKSTFQYEYLTRSDVDFSEFEDEGDIVSVTVMETGISSDIKAYEATTYEYDLTAPECVTMELPGVRFNEESEFVIYQSLDITTDSYIPQSELVIDGSGSGFVSFKSFGREINPNLATSSNWALTSNRNVTIKVTGSIKGSGSFNAEGSRDIVLINQDGVVRHLIAHLSVTGNFEVNVDANITLIPSEKLFLYIVVSSGTGAVVINEGGLNFFYETFSDPSRCKGYRVIDLYKAIIEKISPGIPSESLLLRQDVWDKLIMTSGDGIREISGSKIKISMSDFYQFTSSVDDVALGFENGVVRMERGSYFFKNTEIMNIGEVKSRRITVATDFLFNGFEIGYDDGNTDDYDGREEYNSGQEYALPARRVQKKENWISKVRADQFGIEKLRVKYNIKKDGTSDTSSDNDTFAVVCNLVDGIYKPILAGTQFASITGLTSPATAYNVDLTPKRNLLRHGSFLRGILDGLSDKEIMFTSAKKNAELATLTLVTYIKERDNVFISSLPPAYFLPYILEVEGSIPKGSVFKLDSDMYGYITCSYRGVFFKGSILEI